MEPVDHHRVSLVQSSDGIKRVVNEMDFFADDRSSKQHDKADDDVHHHHVKTETEHHGADQDDVNVRELSYIHIYITYTLTSC